jgi:hypothetical protein
MSEAAKEDARKAKGRDRVRKYREQKQNVTSSNVTRVTTPSPSPDGPLSLPHTPSQSPLNPPTPTPDLSAEADEPARQNLKKTKAKAKSNVIQRPEYPGDYEMLWAEFPRNPNASKLEAFRSWSRLADEDRELCFEGAIAYASWLGGQQRPPPPLHLATFINQRRFDGFADQEAAQ